jgi:hypothetical protein
MLIQQEPVSIPILIPAVKATLLQDHHILQVQAIVVLADHQVVVAVGEDHQVAAEEAEEDKLYIPIKISNN